MAAPIDRFMARVVDTGSCWNWTGAHTPKGYARFWFASEKVYAHRWSYEWFVAPIPEGLVIDHLCRNRGCVNPNHLEAVTYSVNNLRAHAAHRRTACRAGHPYVEGSFYAHGGRRYCRLCSRARARRQTG